MQVHATGEYSSAIIVDGESIGRLWRHVEDFSAGASATVSCADGIERKFQKLDDLLAYENSTRAAVKTVEIFGSSRTPDRSISVTVGRSYGARAALSVRGEEQEVAAARTRVLDSFAGMRAWYSPVATLDLWIVWFAIFMAFSLIIQLMLPSEAPKHPERTFSEALQLLVKLVLYVAPAFVVIFGVSRLKVRYFPMVSMAIGQGARRHSTDEQVRWTVIVGLLVGLAGSAIYARIGGT
ncbi:hypothetical protein WL76_11605 [Burkholderia ubonensis]|uniref:hypothetical protein n=1 Tax=Burkholderia ubonensis TaxID=101571 RepID=UPI00076C58C0|nr:hypothetical protein [Burkholderia ubonensis]KWE56572.1 hypothetical protein WL76_11605 [Burkholderia ubonensis]